MSKLDKISKECEAIRNRYAEHRNPYMKIGALSETIRGLEVQVDYWKSLYEKTLKRKKLT